MNEHVIILILAFSLKHSLTELLVHYYTNINVSEGFCILVSVPSIVSVFK